MGRVLSVEDYGLFSAMLALTVILNSPLGGLQLIITRHVSARHALGGLSSVKNYFHKNLIYYSLVGATVLFVIYFFSAVIQVALQVENFYIYVVICLICLLGPITTICSSFVQGLQLFFWFGCIGVFGVGLKIFGSLLFTSIEGGALGGLIGVLISSLGVAIFGIAIVLFTLSKKEPSLNSVELIKMPYPSLPVFVASTAFSIMIGGDIYIANIFLQPLDVSLYACAATLGKGVIYISGGLVTALFPMVVERHVLNKGTAVIFIQSLLLTLFFAGGVALTYWFFGNEIIVYIYGDKYYAAGNLLKWYGFAMLPVSIVILIENFLIAKGKILFTWIFALALPMEFIAINFWHEHPMQLILVILSFGLALLFLGISLMFYSGNKNFLHH